MLSNCAYSGDDGAAVFLNGQEVFRDNLAVRVGDSRHVRSESAIADADETTFLNALISPDTLVPGTNHLAVEIHQCDQGIVRPQL